MPGAILNKRAGNGSRSSPLALLLALLVLLFCAETIVMLVFDTSLREYASVWVIALVDAALLAVVASFAAWHLLVRPLQAALSGEAAYARAVFDAATEAIITIDLQGTIAGFNPAAERMFGYPAAEVTGRNVALLVRGDHAHRNERFVSWCLAASREAQRPQSREWSGMHKEGREIPIEVDLTIVPLSGATRCTCFMRDIAERKRIEESTRLLAYCFSGQEETAGGPHSVGQEDESRD